MKSARRASGARRKEGARDEETECGGSDGDRPPFDRCGRGRRGPSVGCRDRHGQRAGRNVHERDSGVHGGYDRIRQHGRDGRYGAPEPAQHAHGRHHARLRHARRAAGVAARRLAHAPWRQLTLLGSGGGGVDDRRHERRAERGRVAELAHRQRPHDVGRHLVHRRPLREDRPRHAHAHFPVLPRRGDVQQRLARDVHRLERRRRAHQGHRRRVHRRRDGRGGRALRRLLHQQVQQQRRRLAHLRAHDERRQRGGAHHLQRTCLLPRCDRRRRRLQREREHAPQGSARGRGGGG